MRSRDFRFGWAGVAGYGLSRVLLQHNFLSLYPPRLSKQLFACPCLECRCSWCPYVVALSREHALQSGPSTFTIFIIPVPADSLFWQLSASSLRP
jgi:hypothetical protein